MAIQLKTSPKAPALALAALAAIALAAPAEAETGYRALCAGQYCFHVSSFAKSRTLDGKGLWDVYYYISFGNLRPTHYNIRLRNAAGQTVQIEVPGAGTRSAVRAFGVKPGGVYVVSTQACTRQFLGKSQCTAWRTTRFTAPNG
ncbi:MAG: hypothetical protein JNM29_02620 [Candidatus Odyssella sp.]|nr:hypothetical protein [Candidatus Odyssella sp.]